ncbi:MULTISPECIES: sulfatase-like hydrolase/transferase [Acidobacteriaceae]|uniref:sulfatase-like hydrolase/transferase n=1 Tax=Acidobacteriaceae TaxID=204434 RepID=UPI00131E39EE|nr:MULTISPECIES: sulfatase-like hydrolase/transferase [Acidobacteriaceae]MDW5264659.1 sulfatase-like hydrolase/transferase [Edaphobacter sp.]
MPIDRRLFLQRLAAGSATVVLGDLSALALPVAQKKPNIVVILSDDVGYGDISSYGATHVHTPNIDSMAAAGLRFTRAHSDSATCTPSRYAMLTGSYAWRQDGVQILPGDEKLLLDTNRATVASVLKSAGYARGLVGKWHLGLGDGKIDWNGEIKPGPCEVGFDDAFFLDQCSNVDPVLQSMLTSKYDVSSSLLSL